MERPLNQDDNFEDINIPNEFKEYLITEWTTDHGHTKWWSHKSCVREWGEDRDEWNCMIHEVRVLPDKNILTRADIAKMFCINETDMIII